MLAVRELTYASLAVRILASILLGGMIGLDRGLKNRPAGLRTYMLVCLGACIVMITNQYVFQAFGVGDPVRMGAQVVSGIGFLGAGTIIVTARNQIKGLTTAAGLWASACVGLALGIGLYEVAVIGGVSIFVVLALMHKLDFLMRRNTRIMEVYVELKRSVPLGAFLDFVRAQNFEPSNLQMQLENTSDLDVLAFSVTLKGPKEFSHSDIVQTVRNMDGVSYMEEL
ncbi:MAG TPA: MgtC/SapB family protein [Clostridia bacterium]|nr:MgtC/SapB family protein [Clostridia bacterium]HPK16384.1 MgtC/SapB family protein [Clostridia bacterium]